jgi:uncharacterized protein
VLRARANNAGKNPVWTSYEKLRTVIEKKMFSNTEELLPVISFNAKASADEAKKHEDFVTRMVAKGYTPKQVRLLCEWYLRVRKSQVVQLSAAGEPTCSSIIDRRLAGKNKSIGNRERFLRRYKEQVREAVKRAIDGRGIRDIERGEDIHIPKRDISEPVFGHGQGGVRETVHPGNKDYIRGDRIERPQGRRRRRQRQGPGQRLRRGRGRLRLQRSARKSSCRSSSRTWRCRTWCARSSPRPPSGRASAPASPATARRTTCTWCARCAAPSAAASRSVPARGATLRELEERLAAAAPARRRPAVDREIAELETEIALLRAHRRIPYLDPIDLRYRNRVRVPVPTSKAVMFCLMDVSGSMDEGRKELSKRFFILLYLFLTRHYEKIDIVFIRHHTQAQEVDEENFFHARETGGTVVSSALVLMEEIIRARYNPSEWNIYGAQASDGDNWHHDSGRCRELLAEKILPLCRYYAYVQVAEEEQNLWEEYTQLLQTHRHFAMRKAVEAGRSTRCSATCSRRKGRRRHETPACARC